MSAELNDKIHELELRCKELQVERDATKEAHRVLNNWRNENLHKINDYDQILKCHEAKTTNDLLCGNCIKENS